MQRRHLLRSVFWLYGSQFATVLFQFGYAAITSRLLNAEQFGSYAVALSLSGLIALLASGGTSQAISRASLLSQEVIKGLLTVTIFAGAVGALCIALFARLWSLWWGNPHSEIVSYYLALNVFLTPTIALGTSVLRRQNKYKQLALSIFLTNLAGMIIGGLAVFSLRSSESLTLSLTLSQFTLCVVTLLLIGRSNLGLLHPRNALDEVKFSLRIILVKILEFTNGNALKWGVSTLLGSSTMGIWNRTEVLTTVPFSHFQTSILQVAEPEFRHARNDPSSAKDIWTSLLRSIASIFFPLGVVAGVTLPFISPLLIGQKWHIGPQVFIPLALVGSLTLCVSLLNSAVQSQGIFRRVWISHFAVLVTQFAGLALLRLTMSFTFALDWILVALLVQHSIQIAQCSRSGLLDTKLVIRVYLGSLAFGATLGASLYVIYSGIQEGQLLSIQALVAVAACAALVVCAIINRKKLPFMKAARAFDLARAQV